jgi:FkbM family methyltransferase
MRLRSYLYRNDESEIRLIKYLVTKDDLSIDIGAHKGAYTYELSKYSRIVYAFEAIPFLASMIQRGSPDNVIVENSALSDRKGKALLSIPSGNLGMATLNNFEQRKE